MQFFAFGGLINGLLASLLGIFVLSRKPHDTRHRIYALFCLCLSVWSYSYFLWLVSEDSAAALFWSRLLMAGAIYIPPTAFHYLVELIERKMPRHFIAANYLFSTILFVSNWGTWVVRDIGRKDGFAYWPNPGPLFHFHLAQLVLLALLGLWILRQELREADGFRRNQIKFLILAEIVGWAGGATNYPLWYDIPLAPYGNILVSAYTAIFAYAMVRYRLLDIKIVIKKSLIYGILLLALLIPCYLVLIGTQLVFFGQVHPVFSLVALILFILVGFLFPKLRFRTEEAFERVLFKKHYDYRETLLRSSKEMISMVDLETVCNNLVQTVVKALEIEEASLFLLEESNGSFRIKSNVGLTYDPSRPPMVPQDDSLVRTLVKRREAIIREELGMLRDGREALEASVTMGQLQAEITLPLLTKDRLIGMLNLGHREGNAMYSYEDIEVLSTLANQAAIAIDNARLYDNLKQSQNIIRRADRLSSLGMLTAGLAHEIRNPLVAIRTFTQLLPERYEDKDFRDSFQSLALKEVDRICGLVTDLLSFARPSTPNVTAENINEIVDNIARILDTEAKEKDVRINLRLAPGLPKIFVDKEQTKQVCMNLILNAIQSIEGGGVVEIATHLSLTNGHEQFVQVEVRDSGVGIPEKDLENIFNPFFTTKKDGNGLGLSISHQIVKEHGGHIVVESGVGRGTTFFINLPLKYVAQPGAKYRPAIHEAYSGH